MMGRMVWAGSNMSFEVAEEAILQLTDCRVSAGRIRRQTEQVGEACVAERTQQIEAFETMPLPKRRLARPDSEVPDLAVVMMDGGRYQRRDHFRKRGSGLRSSTADSKTHWRESKVGCLLSMESGVHQEDPCPDIPETFAQASVVHEIAKMAEIPENNTVSATWDAMQPSDLALALQEPSAEYTPPKLAKKDVIASGKDSQAFGKQLATCAHRLNFHVAARQAFVADGAKTNWSLRRKHFPNATPIVDILHALAYAWSASQAEEGKATYQKWAALIWRGDVAEVIEHLQALQHVHGKAPAEMPSDPRTHVDRALTYFTNNAHHMDYPRYRCQGLPITSAHIESTVKQINRRIKGTEKFWLQETSESVLQLRANYLSDTKPMKSFWTRYFANQTGANQYTTASTKLQST